MQTAFAGNFDQGLEQGASLAITVRGELVVDIWAGDADGNGRPWERDTITNVWSTTKTMAALCLLILADRGELDPDAPVAKYWPEFAANGKTTLLYDRRAVDDLQIVLKEHGDWMELGSADEQKPAKDGSVEAWGRSNTNPIGGWYGLKKGLRGRFGMYMPPLMEALGIAEVEHNPRSNRMRAI